MNKFSKDQIITQKNIGKTELLRAVCVAKGWSYYFVNQIDQLRGARIKPGNAIVFDEANLADEPPEYFKIFAGLKHGQSLSVRYENIYIPAGVPRLISSNADSPTEFLPKPRNANDLEAMLRRCLFVRVAGPLFRQAVGESAQPVPHGTAPNPSRGWQLPDPFQPNYEGAQVHPAPHIAHEAAPNPSPAGQPPASYQPNNEHNLEARPPPPEIANGGASNHSPSGQPPESFRPNNARDQEAHPHLQIAQGLTPMPPESSQPGNANAVDERALDALRELVKMKKEGFLDEVEFAAAKKRILNL